MSDDEVFPLDAEALGLFARKGMEAGAGAPQVGQANGVKVRRIMQLTRDLTRRPFPDLRILDLGCGEGVYSVEAALRGARVLALDARIERMRHGEACARRHGLDRVRFVEDDVRRATRDRLGTFDVVYLLGLLYHLDAPEVFEVLEQARDLCEGWLLIDTLVSLAPETEVVWRGEAYRGQRCREHEDGDPAEVRRSRVLKSIDNTFSFRFAPHALVRALGHVGFTSVLECRAPLEPGKRDDRLTIAAFAGTRVRLSTYPWVNEASEAEIERRLAPGGDGDEPHREAGDVP